MLKIIQIFLVIQMLLLTGCNQCILKSGRTEYYELVKIPRSNEAERVQKLSTYDIEKQIDIFLYAAECSEDPSVTSLLTNSGESKIVPIVKKIRESANAEDKYYLIRSLSYINWKCHCINDDLIKALADAKSENFIFDSPSERFFKEQYKSYLDDIKGQN